MSEPTTVPTRPRASEAEANVISQIDAVELTTVGIDVGSATSHVMIARLQLRRRASHASSAFDVVSRQLLHRSPVLLTPFAAHETIDASALRAFVEQAYDAAAIGAADVDAGAVILTGVALERANAEAIATELAALSGDFVCVCAGHNFEAVLAAQGSGAVALSDRDASTILVVDVGGATTKVALVHCGAIVGTMALAAGGRLLHWDADGRIVRCEPALAAAAASLGLNVEPGHRIDQESVRALAAQLADRIVAAVEGRPHAEWLLTPAIAGGPPATRVVLSGGVMQWYGDGGSPDVLPPVIDDLGAELAKALRQRLDAHPLPVTVAESPMWSTVVGASQFSMQLSGSTVFVGAGVLPRRNVPVVTVAMGAGEDQAEMLLTLRRKLPEAVRASRTDAGVAVAVEWAGAPSHARLRRLAQTLVQAYRELPAPPAVLVVVLAADVAASLGCILAEEATGDISIAVLDGLDLKEFDFIDIGRRTGPTNTYPVVLKSLLFAAEYAALERADEAAA